MSFSVSTVTLQDFGIAYRPTVTSLRTKCTEGHFACCCLGQRSSVGVHSAP